MYDFPVGTYLLESHADNRWAVLKVARKSGDRPLDIVVPGTIYGEYREKLEQWYSYTFNYTVLTPEEVAVYKLGG